MYNFKPIYTEKADCRDCYKCVRICPVKSIKVVDGSAMVINENCILCGACVEVCPAGAKRVRDDLSKVKELIKKDKSVIVSLAPSFLNEFPEYSSGQLAAALKKLGFYGVSETALGAEIVSASTAEIMRNNSGKIIISSACPTIVDYIKKYVPQLSDSITSLYSPLLAHCALLRKEFGSDTKVVFIGPCISKKREADDFNDLLFASLNFEDLREWLNEEELTPDNIQVDSESFIPSTSSIGRLYPIAGGMIAGIKNINKDSKDSFMSFSGIDRIIPMLEGIANLELKNNLFLELLACTGGCINGPKALNRKSTIVKRFNVLSTTEFQDKDVLKDHDLNIECEFNIKSISSNNYKESEIDAILNDIGKHDGKNEFNCGGCGYDNCKDFAISLLDGKSEKTMCVTYMRQLAQKKANALIKTMPSGVVIVDENLKIIESNLNWAKLMGEETEMLFDVKPGLEGASLQRIIPFAKLFQNVLDTGVDIVGKEIEFNKSILLFSLFTIEKHKYVGGIFRDITEPWVRKEQIINKAKLVIKQNLTTVQKIAYLLGENASETEITLNSIIESFSTDKIDDLQ